MLEMNYNLHDKLAEHCRRIDPESQLIQCIHDARDEPWMIGVMVYLLEETTEWNRIELTNFAVKLQRICKLLRPLWIKQGKPDANGFAIHLNAFSKNDSAFLRTHLARIGGAVDRAVLTGRAPRELVNVAHMLMLHRPPESRGWANLVIPTATMLLLLRRSASPSEHEVNPEMSGVYKFLCHHRGKPWAMTIVCVAIALMGERGSDDRERNTPKSILVLIKMLTKLLECVFESRELVSVREIKNSDLVNYLKGSYGGQGEHARHRQVQAYLYCVDALARLRSVSSEHEILPVECHFLPVLNAPADLIGSPNKTLRSSRRAAQIRATTVNYHILRSLAQQRSLIMNYLLQNYRAFLKEQDLSNGAVEFNISLEDQSATLHFQIDSFQRMYAEVHKGDLRYNRVGKYEDVALIKYCGATKGGIQLEGVPYFIDYLMRRFSPAIAAEDSNGHPNSDYKSKISGLITPTFAISRFARKESLALMAEGDASKILFDLESVYAASALGTLIAMLGTGTGMRIHEIQQIRLEKDFIGTMKDDRTKIYVYEKGEKRENAVLTEHILESKITSLILDVINNHKYRQGKFSVLELEDGPAFGFSAGRYLFQWNNRTLTKIDMNVLLRFCIHGTVLRDPVTGERMSLSACLLRNAYGQARKKSGHSKLEIQHALNHSESQMTDHYLREEIQLPSLLRPPALTDWEALGGRHP